MLTEMRWARSSVLSKGAPNTEKMAFVDQNAATDPKEPLSALRLNPHRGRPLGGDALSSKIEALVGRRLRPLPLGRPRKRERRQVTVRYVP